MNKYVKLFLCTGCLFAMFAVIAGAFGAHLLKSHLTDALLAAFKTAVLYQFLHAFGLIILAILLQVFGLHKGLLTAGVLFILGIVCFCGSLYILTLLGIKSIALLTPIGGIMFVFAWLVLFIVGLTINKSAN